MTKEEEIRSAVIQTAQSLFKQFGINKTSMEDIAKAMGKGKSTLYYYYSGKDEIINAVIDFEITAVHSNVKKAIDNVDSAEEKFRTYILKLFDEVKKEISAYNIVVGELQENHKILGEFRRMADSFEVNMMAEILSFGIRKKEFNINEKELDLLVYTLASAIRGLTIDFLVEKNFQAREEPINMLIDIFIKGLKK